MEVTWNRGSILEVSCDTDVLHRNILEVPCHTDVLHRNICFSAANIKAVTG